MAFYLLERAMGVESVDQRWLIVELCWVKRLKTLNLIRFVAACAWLGRGCITLLSD